MSASELSEALVEVRGVLDSLRTRITVVPCDAVAYEPIKVFVGSDLVSLRRQLQHGGGTEMTGGINAALELQPAPNARIVLTDGYAPLPAFRYMTPFVFGIFKPAGTVFDLEPRMPAWRHEDVV